MSETYRLDCQNCDWQRDVEIPESKNTKHTVAAYKSVHAEENEGCVGEVDAISLYDNEGSQCYVSRLEQAMKEIPEEYHEFLWEYTGCGNAPNAVQAAVCYIESSATQEVAAESFNTTAMTLRKTVREMIERGYVSKSDVTPADAYNNHTFDEDRAGNTRWRGPETA